jgi:type IV pilus assembly protein PilY1
MTSRAQRIGSGAGRRLRGVLRLGAAIAGVVSSLGALAGQTDVSQLPLITSAPQVVKPNLMFILDDSGSMSWSHMPDDAENFGQTGGGTKKYGYASAQCNGVYYNPLITYKPPTLINSSGVASQYPDATFTAAWVNGYNTSAGTVNLSTSFRAWTSSTVPDFGGVLTGTNDTAQAAYYYNYTGSQTTAAQKNYFSTSGAFYTECNSDITSNSETGDGKFTKVQHNNPTAWTAAEQTNFANWYSYYRTRMLTMKSATGRAFRDIGDTYRIGFMSINNNVNPMFLNIDDFGGTQKYNWYTKLYSASPDNSTPLREALSNAGRIFANKKSTMYGVTVVDPVQYSCQKNFALLSTDGYWNGSDGFRVDGTSAIDNPDAAEPRPYNDGGSVGNIYTATLNVNANNSSDSVTSIKVGGLEILSSIADASGGGTGSRASKLASKMVTRINNCTGGISGSCTVAGY